MLKFSFLKSLFLVLFFGVVSGYLYDYGTAKYEESKFYQLEEVHLDIKDNYFTLDSLAFTFPKTGKYLIGLWGTYCSICIDKFDDLERVKQQYPDFEIILISSENIAVIKNFIDYHPQYPSLKFIKSNSHFSEMGLLAVPNYFLVENGEGRMLSKQMREIYKEFPVE
ncbi:MAG: hypothetical protein N4A45_05090 [Flavobacteriales bacterium]|jgi:thiol-disulfide isomerase/thioredoxin|nr:hypothetical protein [Flavobacteriales bacterium]